MGLEDNLIAHWDFNDSKGDKLRDLSKYKSIGKIHGAYWSKNDSKVKSLEFDGIDDFIEIEVDNRIPTHFRNVGKGSISVWFRVDYIPLENGIMPIFYYGAKEPCDFFDAANKGLIIEVGHSPISMKSKKLYYTVWANGCTYPSFCFDSNRPIAENQWYHFVVVVDENYNSGYIDGIEIDHRRYNFGTKYDSQFFSSSISHEKIWVGKGFWDGKPMYLKGAISDIRIYDQPLNSEEVMSLYKFTRIQEKQ